MFDCFRKAAPKKLVNIGCGRTYHPDWENYDLAPVHPEIKKINLERSLPLPGKSYEAVYCSHVLEHLSRSRVPQVLKEFARILQPGGICRIVVPDLEQIARQYVNVLEAAKNNRTEAVYQHGWLTLELFDQMTRTWSGGFMGKWLGLAAGPIPDFISQRIGAEASRNQKPEAEEPLEFFARLFSQPEGWSAKAELEFQGSGEKHRWMYDQISLRQLMRMAGFAEIVVRRHNESSITNFVSYRLDSDSEGRPRKPDSLFMEGSIPKE